MLNIKVDAVLFIQRYSGLPLLSLKLNPRVLDIDPALISGFLMAIQAFSAEVIEKGTEEFQIDYGKRLFTVIVGSETMAVAVTTEGSSDAIIPVLRELQKEFEMNHYLDLEIHGPSNIYDEFKLEIAEHFGLQDIALSWVPVDKKCDDSELAISPIAPYIDGSSSISDIIEASGIPKEQVLKEISKLWTTGEIDLSNILEHTDIIIPTNEFYKYIQTGTKERPDLKKFSPSLISLLPRLVSCFDGRTTVAEIAKQYDPQVYDLLDTLVRMGALQILSPEKKRILLAKELLVKVLEIASGLYSTQVVLETLTEVLRKTDCPEILAEVHIKQNEWNVDFGFLLYDNHSPNDIMNIHASWIDLLTNLIALLPSNKKKKLAERLVHSLQEEFFEKYSGNELEGFEEFSLSLEAELS